MNLARYVHTLRYLRPIQIYGRFWFLAYRPKPDLRPAPPMRRHTGQWQTWAWRRPLMSGPATFDVLNTTATLQRAGDWDDPARARLLRYNLHYFDDLNATNAAARAEWHRALIARWIRENSPGHGTGWDSYPTSLRMVNWIKWSLASRSGDERGLDSAARDSLATQARWLHRRLETHLLGNHLLANAKALAFAGVFFDGPEAQRWLASSVALLERELDEQILPDGGHFERSPMYQGIVLEDLLDLINLSHAFPECLPTAVLGRLEEAVVRMLRWLEVMSHPDGRIAFFNDAAFGIAPTHAELGEYARQLGVPVNSRPLDSVEALPDSGYVRLQNDRAVVICDVGPIGPDYLLAHAHADTLSFELSLDGRRVLVNSGTSTYDGGPERDRQRGTAAHNCVVVDDQNSSDVWGSFRVGRRARPLGVAWGADRASQWVDASHDGYRRSPSGVIHRRRWELEADKLVIDDRLVPGRAPSRHAGRLKSARAVWHLQPDIRASVSGDSGQGVVDLRSSGGTVLRLSTDPAVTVAVEPSTWHPEFGQSVRNTVLTAVFGSPSLLTRITW